MKRRGSFRAGLGFGALSSLTLIALGLVSSVAIARVYGVEQIGRYALALAPSLALAYLSSAQEQAALVRALSVLEPLDPRATGLFAAVLVFSTALTLVVAAAAIGVTVLVFDGPLGHPGLVGPAAALIASQALLTNTCWNLDMILSAYRAGRELFWIRLLQALSFLLLALAGGMAWGTVWGLVFATAGSVGVGLIHRLVMVRGYLRFSAPRSELRAGFRELPSMVRFGIRLAPSGLANGLSSQVGIWALGATSSLATVGAYQRAWQLGYRFLEMNSRITEMLFPTLVERRADGDREGFDRAVIDTSRYAAVAMLIPAAVGGGAGYGSHGAVRTGLRRCRQHARDRVARTPVGGRGQRPRASSHRERPAVHDDQGGDGPVAPYGIAHSCARAAARNVGSRARMDGRVLAGDRCPAAADSPLHEQWSARAVAARVSSWPWHWPAQPASRSPASGIGRSTRWPHSP